MQGTKARWILPAPMPAGYDASLKHLSPVVAQILYNRGITPDELPAFLHPDTHAMHAPLLMRDMPEAVRRIRSAVALREKIAVYGDFDVDGMTGTVLLHQVFSALGAHCQVYVPHRHSEGYGLNAAALERLRADGVRLIVTVDCGISAAAEVDYGRNIGLDVVVTDHHLPPPRLPDAVAILNPCQPRCSYPFKHLAGVGVAFKLASALVEGLPNGQRLRREVLDLVVVGTVSDMVPLRGENRVLV
ncbi:MAG TPA: DHH family phosphoesterase, partial [Chloroflexota bacterium]|nr:DHH family phosphoesterase [Chloroflexota bacterium]